jgi:hypothetical protein
MSAMSATELGGHGAGYLAVLWLVIGVLFGIATTGAVVVYRRAARRVEMEEVDRIIDES